MHIQFIRNLSAIYLQTCRCGDKLQLQWSMWMQMVFHSVVFQRNETSNQRLQTMCQQGRTLSASMLRSYKHASRRTSTEWQSTMLIARPDLLASSRPTQLYALYMHDMIAVGVLKKSPGSLPGKLPGDCCDMGVTWLDQSEVSTYSWLHEWDPHVEYPVSIFVRFNNHAFWYNDHFPKDNTRQHNSKQCVEIVASTIASTVACFRSLRSRRFDRCDRSFDSSTSSTGSVLGVRSGLS